MKYKLCGDVAILLLSSAERITPGQTVKGEIDAPDGSKIKLFRHKDEMLHYAIVKNGAFTIPYDFLVPDTYSVKIIYGNNSADGTAFVVTEEKPGGSHVILRFTESAATEIANMWKAIAHICTVAEDTGKTAQEAVDAVMKFEKGYRTE